MSLTLPFAPCHDKSLCWTVFCQVRRQHDSPIVNWQLLLVFGNEHYREAYILPSGKHRNTVRCMLSSPGEKVSVQRFKSLEAEIGSGGKPGSGW